VIPTTLKHGFGFSFGDLVSSFLLLFLAACYNNNNNNRLTAFVPGQPG